MTAPLFTHWKFYSLQSKETLRLLTELFPPNPMEWARENARRCFKEGSSVCGYYPKPPGTSELGRAVAVAFTLELLQLGGRKVPPEILMEAANCFDLLPDSEHA